MAATWGPDSGEEPLPVKTAGEIVTEEAKKWLEALDEED